MIFRSSFVRKTAIKALVSAIPFALTFALSAAAASSPAQADSASDEQTLDGYRLQQTFASNFSALEVVPLVVLGFEARENWRLKSKAPWMSDIKWPLMFFVAVVFWNMLGAGVFDSKAA